MDNITHSAIGLGVGELLHRSLPPEPQEAPQRTRRALFLFAAWFASNAPAGLSARLSKAPRVASHDSTPSTRPAPASTSALVASGHASR